MNATEFLNQLETLGIFLDVADGDLLVDAPEEAVTEELRAQLVRHKVALLPLVAERQAPQREQCAHCSAPVEYYSDQGQPCCREHRYDRSEQQCAASPALMRLTQAEFFIQDLAEVQDVLAATPGPIALDLETTGLDPQQDRVVSIALGRPGAVFLLDLRPYYALGQEWQAQWNAAIVRFFQALRQVTWIGHNLKFDWTFLAIHFDVHLKHVYDTMLVEQLLRCTGLSPTNVGVSLLETAKRYDLAVTKEQRSWFEGLHRRPAEWAAPFPPEQLRYIVQDIDVPCRVAERQHPLIKRYDLQAVTDLENGALPAIASMEVHGALIDQIRWRQVLQIKQKKRAALEPELRGTLGQALYEARRIASPKQQQRNALYTQALRAEQKRLKHAYRQGTQDKSEWVFLQAGVQAWKEQHPEPKPPKPPTKEIKLTSPFQLREALTHLGISVTSTEEDVLEDYAGRFPIVARLLAWRKLQHFCSTCGEKVPAFIQADGRLHAHFNQVGALSGRIICSKPNLQQIPKKRVKEAEEEDIRRCFIAPPGFRLLKADLSNIELRILAEVSRDATMLRFFAERKDLHEETAKLMFRLPPETDTRKHLYKGVVVRDIAKTINFGLAYGMGAQGLANRVGVSIEEARKLMRTYFDTYTGVAAFLRQTAQQAIQRGYAVTLAGRKRFFQVEGLTRAQRGSLERVAKNHPIQGTNADILKRALTLLYERLPSETHMILTVHDEIVLECPENLVAEMEPLLKETMVQACREYLKVVHIPEPDVLNAPYWQKE